MAKILIKVWGGMIQDIITTDPELEVFVYDSDMAADPDYENAPEDAGWQYWESKGGDRVVNKKLFKEYLEKVNS